MTLSLLLKICLFVSTIVSLIYVGIAEATSPVTKKFEYFTRFFTMFGIWWAIIFFDLLTFTNLMK